jgi:hypothetical protein
VNHEIKTIAFGWRRIVLFIFKKIFSLYFITVLTKLNAVVGIFVLYGEQLSGFTATTVSEGRIEHLLVSSKV